MGLKLLKNLPNDDTLSLVSQKSQLFRRNFKWFMQTNIAYYVLVIMYESVIVISLFIRQNVLPCFKLTSQNVVQI